MNIKCEWIGYDGDGRRMYMIWADGIRTGITLSRDQERSTLRHAAEEADARTMTDVQLEQWISRRVNLVDVLGGGS